MKTRFAFIALACGIASAASTWAQSPSFQDRAALRRIERDLATAAQLAEQADWPAAAGYAERGTVELRQLVGDQSSANLIWVRRAILQATDLHGTLSARVRGLSPLGPLEPIAAELRSLPDPQVETPNAGPQTTLDKMARPQPTVESSSPAATEVSFARDVAPILTAKCGRCHIDAAKGRISLATHNAILDTPDLVHVGQPDTSELVAVIESGDMPRGSLKVSPAELQILRRWIAAGASCGEGEAARSLADLAAAQGDPAMASVDSSAADSGSMSRPTSGDDATLVSFSRSVAPILIENCAGCHIDARQVRANLNLGSFAMLGRGGDSGALFTAGAGEASFLIEKLRGTAGGMQMPAGRPPLPDETIATIARWIDEGARFDGFSPTASLRDVYARARAGDSSHEQLQKEREQRAIANWNLIMGGKQPLVEHGEHFTLLGGDASADLKSLGELADKTLRDVAKQLKAGSREPFVKGNIAVYVFQTRYDFSEFGKMIEQRELPRESYLHWGNTTLDAYLALQAKPTDYPALAPALARGLVAIYLRGQAGDVPAWFADGYGVWIASQLYPNDPTVKTWGAKSTELLNQIPSKDDFLTGRLSSEDSALVGSQFISFLKANGNNEFAKFLKDLKAGEGFDRSFQVNFGASPQEIVQAAAPDPR